MSSMEEMRGLFDVKGKVAVVTGAASGIGEGIAYAFAANGGKVVAVDIKEDELSRLVRNLISQNADAIAVKADISDPESVKEIARKAIEKYGKIDALYAVPAINVRKKIFDYTYEEFDRVIRVNLRGTFALLKEIGLEISRNPDGGSIVVLSSIRSQIVEPGQSVYAGTKAAVLQMARTLAAELGSKNVRVNAIGPGVVDTPLTAQIKNDKEWYSAYADKSPLKRWASVKEIAGPCLFLATPAASFINGTILFVDGGWTGIDGRYEPKL